jgi:hypothetical protein
MADAEKQSAERARIQAETKDRQAEEVEEDEDEEEVDVDLDEQDAALRADIGRPLRMKINGKVLVFPHMDSWEYIYSRMMSMGDFTGWAKGVLSEDDFRHWASSDIKNYQIQKVVQSITLHAGLAGGLGKSSRSSRSSQRRRKR